jgi:hypothetical protein
MKMKRAAACAAVLVLSVTSAFAQAATPAAAPAAGGAAAASGGKLLLELNNAQTADNSCRVTFVIQNNTTTAIQSSSYTMSLFDTSGQIIKPVNLKFPPFPVNKIKVIQFPLDLTCDKIQGIVPDETECVAADGTPSTVCDDSVLLRSKTKIQFPWTPDLN